MNSIKRGLADGCRCDVVAATTIDFFDRYLKSDSDALDRAGLGRHRPGSAARPRPRRQNEAVNISAKADYAVCAAVELAATDDGGPVKGEALARTQQIPTKFLENIMSDLRRAGIVASQRGAVGGYWLARPASDITLAEVIRAVDGPLANVRGARPEKTAYTGATEALVQVWVAVRASLRSVLESVTLADVAGGRLPAKVNRLARDPDAWVPH
jgi:Rrf2 family protein